ncbi:MAG TPA: glutamate racemase [Bacteroidota bacterium]
MKKADGSAGGQLSRPIGVFDSGIGGLTVVRALLDRLPHENIVYFGDTARVPYGPKSAQVVREYAAQDVEFLLSKQVKMIVVACNTVSAVALDVVQRRAHVPVVDVIHPSSKFAVAATKNKRVGVVGTVGTIASKAYVHAIRQLDPAVQVFGKPCPLFVPIAEEGWANHKVAALVAREYLFPLTLERIDTLILGCTHYPLLKQVIRDAVDGAVTLIDSGEASAAAVEHDLEVEGLKNPSTERPNVDFYVSDIPEKFTEVGERFLGRTLGRVRRADPYSFGRRS